MGNDLCLHIFLKSHASQPCLFKRFFVLSCKQINFTFVECSLNLCLFSDNNINCLETHFHNYFLKFTCHIAHNWFKLLQPQNSAFF